MANFKQNGVWFLPLAMLLILIGASSAVFARTAPGTTPPAPPKLMSQRELNGNAWQIYTTNYGPFANPGATSGGFWPIGTGHGYIYGAGLWVGATDAAGNKIVACGYDPNSGQYEMGPVSMDNSYGAYLSDPKARVYLSSDPVDEAEWPATAPTIKSRQDSYAKFSDQNPAFTFSGEKQLGVLVEQTSYAWNYADNNDIVFFYFKVTNISGKDWSKVYMGPGTDCDIGDEGGVPNDRCGFDFERNLSLQYQSDPEPGWTQTGVVGFRYLESPINNTGATINIIDNQFSRSVLPDSALGMTAFKVFTLETDPPTDEERYLEMTGVNWFSMEFDAYDEWGANEPDDKRFMMASGPFNLANGASTTTCIGCICAADTNALKLSSDVAQTIYDNGFELATPPAAPALSITPGDKYIRLSWGKISETTPDPYWAKLTDTMDWYTYFPGSWEFTLPATKLLVDSFEIKTSDTTSAVIARGWANPAMGTDTVRAFYAQKPLYDRYDFQGYVVFRARTQADLANRAKREYVGPLGVDVDPLYNDATFSFGGGNTYAYDKIDGIEIVRDLEHITNTYPGGSIAYPIYDTLGIDRGLIYTIVDSNVVNGMGYWYGVSAYDYQSNVYFTHKCPTTLMTNPSENATYAVARTQTADLMAANVKYTVFGPTDYKTGGAVNYGYTLTAIPKEIVKDTFRLVWKPTTKLNLSGINYPVYHAELRDMWPVYGDTLLQTIDFCPKYQAAGDDDHSTYNGTLNDEVLFGGVVFNFDYKFDQQLALVETVQVNSGTYPEDSIWALAYGPSNTFFTPSANCWQWRGSNYEIQWRDSSGTVGTNPNGSILCATVWDLDNNIEVPLESGVSKANMTQSSWCFNLSAIFSARYADSLTLTSMGMYIAGINLFFNRRNGGTIRRMVWSERPHTGDTWTVHCTGAGNPMEGGVATFITTPGTQVASPMASLLDAIKVVPNPYLVRANWDVSKNYPNIYFTRLPAKCTIRIFNLAGDLIRVINHDSAYDDNNGSEIWDLLTTYDKRPASGIYIYQIDAPGIGTKLGKFAIIK